MAACKPKRPPLKDYPESAQKIIREAAEACTPLRQVIKQLVAAGHPAPSVSAVSVYMRRVLGLTRRKVILPRQPVAVRVPPPEEGPSLPAPPAVKASPFVVRPDGSIEAPDAASAVALMQLLKRGA